MFWRLFRKNKFKAGDVICPVSVHLEKWDPYDRWAEDTLTVLQVGTASYLLNDSGHGTFIHTRDFAFAHRMYKKVIMPEKPAKTLHDVLTTKGKVNGK